MRVVWTAAALRDVTHVHDYLKEFHSRAAMRLATALLTAGDGLADFPERGRSVGKTGFCELLTITPYVIRYRIAADDVVILRVRHSARRPTDP